MSLYANGQRAILLLKPDDMFKMINIFHNLDVHRSLVDYAQLVDIGCREFKDVPTNRKEYVNQVIYKHNFLIFKQ